MKKLNNIVLVKNIGYNILLQTVTFILPFVLTPYVARVLTPEGTGIYSFTNSIVNYFLIFASIGLSIYGTRQIAFVKEKPDELSKTFFILFGLKFITTTIAFIVFMTIIPTVSEKYRFFLALQSIQILAVIFDISWLYSGLGNFKIALIRTLIVKPITIALTFIFVRTYSDLWIYVLITSFGSLCGNLIMWWGINNYVHLIRIHFSDIIREIKPVSIVFISFIAIEIYTVLDKFMIGVLATETQVGLYTYAEQFAKAGLGIIGAISTVLLPYMSNLKQNGNNQVFADNFNDSLNMISMIGIAASFGIAGIAKQFIPWMLGDSYLLAIPLLNLLAPLTTIISTSNIISRAYLLPSNKEKICNIGVIVAAVVNITLNFLLIPKYAAAGACMGTIAAELSVTGIYIIASKSVFNFKRYGISLLKYFVSGSCMLVVVRVIGIFFGAEMWTTVLQVLVGIIVYCLVLIVLKEKMIKNCACLVSKTFNKNNDIYL